MKKLSDIENLEFTKEDISLVGLIILAIISLLHTNIVGLYIAIPVMIVLIFNALYVYLLELIRFFKSK